MQKINISGTHPTLYMVTRSVMLKNFSSVLVSATASMLPPID